MIEKVHVRTRAALSRRDLDAELSVGLGLARSSFVGTESCHHTSNTGKRKEIEPKGKRWGRTITVTETMCYILNIKNL